MAILRYCSVKRHLIWYLLTVVASILNLTEACCEQTTEESAKGRCTKEERNSQSKLAAPVEHGNVYYKSTNQTSFAESEKHASHNEALIGLHCAHTYIDDAPCDDQTGQISPSSVVLYKPVAGERHQHIWHIKDYQGDIKVITDKSEVRR